MNKEPDPVGSLLKSVLDSYKEEHRELSEIWRNLDAKSQGVVAIDGIFIAAMFAFVRGLGDGSTCNQKWMLTIAASILTISVILSIIALWVRSVPSAPIGKSLESLVTDLMNLQDGTEPERLHNLSRDHAELWRDTNSKIHRVNGAKATLLMTAQIALLVAILVMVLHLSFTIWS
jgi:hypothetical protein